MSYIGNEPRFTQFPSKFFNGDGSSQTVSLDYAPPNKAAILVFIAGVRQDTDAYTLTGTSLTFTGTVPSGTNNVQVVHLGLTVQVPAPADDTITTAKIQDDAITAAKILADAVTTVKILDDNVTTAKILDNNVTLAKLGDGTQGDILYYGASGAPARLGFGTSGDFLKTQGTGANPVWDTVTEYDDSGVQDDIALLGFKVATNGSLGKYNLVDQTEDSFQDESGIDTSTSIGEIYDSSGKFYSGVTAGGVAFTTSYTAAETISWTADTGTVEVLVVAGGGAGGDGGTAGGGGAGGVVYHASKTITQGNSYTITVGAGGAVQTNTNGATGANSVFSDMTANGGGGGGKGNDEATDGGSGGGGTPETAGPNTGGSATQGSSGGGTGYGYDGGDGFTGSGTNDQAGGGGGASAVGADGASGDPGDGGNGYANSISGGSVTYAGGGGGGSRSTTGAPGGSGGGGAGGPASGNGVAGTVNTGSGGGGAGTSGNGAAGGSGIVIVKGTTVAAYDDITLISASTTAEGDPPTKGDIVMTYSNGAGTAVANNDIKAYISRDGSAYSTAVTLVDQGDTGGHTILTAHNVDISGITSGNTMRFKIETLNQAVGLQTKIHAVSLGWS